MINRREIVTCVILSIVTCGIYGIIWFVGMIKDIKTASEDSSLPDAGVAILLSIVTCGIYMMYLYYKFGKDLQIAKQKKNMPATDNSVLYLVLCLVGLSIVSTCLVQNELNEIAGPEVTTTPVQ